MRTLSEIQNEIIVRLSTGTTVAYYTDTIIKEWITQAHRRCAGYKKWPLTEGRVSTTFASLSLNEDGYLRGSYPEGWRPDSIRLLTIGGKRVHKTNFYKFQSYFEDNPDSSDRKFTDQGRSYFINPNIDLSGTVVAWGQYTPYIDVTDENATTVFSDVAEEGNLAIVEEVISYAQSREKKHKEKLLYSTNAMKLLDTLWDSIKNEQFGYASVDDDGMFQRLDVLGGNMRDDIFKRDQFN